MSSKTPRWRGFGREIRWTLTVLVVAVLGVVALWPREDDTPSTPETPANSGRAGADLGELRARAALAECSPAPRSGPSVAELEGASGTCLGDGSPVELADMLGERGTLINVWASWCPPCRRELPALQSYSEQPDSVRVIGVQVRSDAAGGLELLDSLDVRLPVVHDSGGRVAERLRVPTTLPVSYLVTPEGEVRRMPPEVFDSATQVRQAVHSELEAR
ncbi:TlpA family protein disulfide reductase [Actinopolyspora mortivallis]|uniref:TlpA family protein disulfide reductase n=1 Tax=Actinopolyspora mortivallis TaxID=33906 RepID=A0A2T0GWA2_ACTMO|nr:TlpA disulfide reductase family protein [Actinopolyspora mortivallis]PRW63382.1 TlpA family protein disulfide reductase [Actinopolyspora mortivallis]